jgi:hypothetical protein
MMYTVKKGESRMTGIPPKVHPERSQLPPMPVATPADYDDELTNAQLDALRTCAPQDESKMGALVHEFTW